MYERRLSDSSRMCHLLQVLARTSTIAVAFVLLGYLVLLRRSRSVWLQVQRHIQVFVERDLCSLNRLFFRIIATTPRPRERNISRAWHLTSAVAFVTSAFAVHPWNGDCKLPIVRPAPSNFSPPGNLSRVARSGGSLAVTILLFWRCADDASANADLIINHNIEAVAVFVRPYGTDAPPYAGLVASFFGILHDIGDVSWVGHGTFLLLACRLRD
jgi:hypothetical protein